LVVLNSSSGAGHNGPAAHDDGKEDGWANLVQDHVGGNLRQNITDEEDGDYSVVLSSDQTNIFLEGAQTSCGNVVAVEIIENIYHVLVYEEDYR
jgi:hypothetical protein